ncbi:MAG: bifunctional serine/threonine protein kinase/MFS transporter [Planctomycetaceae bacterium]|nr:bifunctional serine/threonine protein kinase/MFS transporter [Planctomycetaceae bacterium]
MKFTFAPESRPLDGYTIKRAIHRGGFGEVYYALSDAGKEVALKLLNNNLDVEIRGVSQCLNLKHPNLVTIFDIRQDTDKDHWVVMEYVSGRGLYETMQDHPSGMPVEQVRYWLEGITAGLSFLHDRGIVHRDLKPANVFRDPSGVKIGDVGLSKYISESRRSAQTQSVGTVYYMAPEVAKGRYGKEVDVYAMGIILYEMLTGRVPFEGQTTAEILMKHLTSDPDVTVLPESLRQVIAAALEKDPDKRTHSVEELNRQFCLAVEGADPAAPISVHQRDPRPFEPTQPAPVALLHSTAGPAPEATAPRPAPQPAAAGTSSSKPTSGFGALLASWHSLPVPLQWVIGGAAALLIIESNLIRPVAVGGMIGGAAYLGYQILRSLTGQPEPGPAQSARAAAAGTPPPRRDYPRPAGRRDPIPERAAAKNPSTKRVYTPATVRKISKSQRATDVFTSLTVSLAAAGLVTTAVYFTTNLLRNETHAVYFGVVTMLAAWGLIIPSKMWEGSAGDSLTRRLTLGVVGLGVGSLASVLPKYLLISDDRLFRGGGHESLMVGRVAVADGTGFPTMACFMLFFAGLFVFRRWWWQADSFRKSRFRISSALFTLVIGIIMTGILQEFSFPDALGATWALAISAVVQLSAGWTPPELRRLEQPPAPDAAKPQSTPEPAASLA